MNDFFLADDLSGALDAAAAFHHAGRRVRIALTFAAWDAAADDEVVGFTTETRNASPSAAADTVALAIAHGRARGGRLLFKKIDSTLRGPVAAELGAVAAALPEARILFTPANPGVGRTVRGGVLFVRGVPVAETEFGRDPVSPVTESAIARLLGTAATPRVTIADAETDGDLAAAVARMDAAGEDWVAIGSGALARPVAVRTSSPPFSVLRPLSPVSCPLTPVLLICGSAHPANRAQAAHLTRERGVQRFAVSLRDGSDRSTHDAAEELRAGRPAALILESAPGAGAMGSTKALQAIVQAATQVIAIAGVTRLFVTGGETARALCAALGIEALEFRAEIEPGLALAEASAARGRCRLAVKPGGFGGEEAWVKALERLAVT